jgi:hypothetical protein
VKNHLKSLSHHVNTLKTGPVEQLPAAASLQLTTLKPGPVGQLPAAASIQFPYLKAGFVGQLPVFVSVSVLRVNLAKTKAKEPLPTFVKMSYFYSGNTVDKPQKLLNSGFFPRPIKILQDSLHPPVIFKTAGRRGFSLTKSCFVRRKYENIIKKNNIFSSLD